MAQARSLNEVRQRLFDAYHSGDEAALATAVRDYKDRRASLKRSFENIDRDQASYDPTEGMSNVEKLAVGNTSGWANVIRRGANLVGADSAFGMDTSKEAIESQKQTDAPLLRTGAGATGRFVGEVAATAPLAGGAGAGVRALGAGVNAAGKAGMLSRALSYGTEGAVGGKLVDDNAAGAGAGLNMLLTPALNRAGRLVRSVAQGMNKTKAAETVLKYGGDPTPGLMDPHSMMGRIERTAATSPLIGQGLAEAREVATRPVVQNLSADLVGIGRREGESMVRSAQRRAGKISRDYAGADSVPLAPESRASIASDRATRIEQVRAARGTGKRAVERKQGALESAVDDAESRFIKATDRLAKNRNPDIVDALEIDVRSARAKLRRAQYAVADMDRRAPVRAGLEAGKNARADFVHSMTQDLESKLTQSLNANRIAKSDPLYREVRQLANSIVEDGSTTSIRKARGELKRLKDSYRYGREGKPSNAAAANVLKEVEGWFDDQLNAAYRGAGKPELVEQVKAADRQFARTRPIEEATASAMGKGGKEVRGQELMSALKNNMTEGAFTKGRGGETRKVAEALIEMRRPHATGFIERNPYLRAALGTLAVPGAAALASRPVRKMLQGTLRYQKPLTRAGKTKQAQMLKRVMLGLRPGVAPAMLDSREAS